MSRLFKCMFFFKCYIFRNIWFLHSTLNKSLMKPVFTHYFKTMYYYVNIYKNLTSVMN